MFQKGQLYTTNDNNYDNISITFKDFYQCMNTVIL